MRQELYEHLNQLRNDENYCEVIKEIATIPDDKLDYDLVILLADAYLHTYKYREATRSLLSVSEKGTEDYIWHFMLGQAYYFTNNIVKAKEELNKAFELSPESDYYSNFMEYYHFHHYIKLRLEKLAGRFVSKCNFLPEQQFADKVTSFWNWFCENELKLSEFSENRERYDSSVVISFISEGMDLISRDVEYNIGEDFTFTFLLNSNSYLFYLLPYLIHKAPQHIQNKWHFSISESQSFGIRSSINGVLIEEVKVALNYDSESNKFDIHYFSADFLSMDNNEANVTFAKMLKMLFSENILRLYVNTVTILHAPINNMFPLIQISKNMSDILESSGNEMIKNPSDISVAYTFGNTDTDKLRYDIISGSTTLLDSVIEYSSDVKDLYTSMKNCGAKLIYIFYTWPMEMDLDKLVSIRYKFEDYLIEEILGEKGSGREIGIILGSAGGSMYEYVDLLIYDMSEFFKRIVGMLNNYQFEFYLADFCLDGDIVSNDELRL